MATTKTRSKSKVNPERRAPTRTKTPTADLVKKVTKLRDDGQDFKAIGKKLKIPENYALFAYRYGQVKTSDRIKGDLTGKQVVALRADGLAWHTIGARAGLGSPAPVKALYEAETGEKATGRAGLPENA